VPRIIARAVLLVHPEDRGRDTCSGIGDTQGMKLAFAVVMMSSTVLAAPCMRPKLLPAALPLLECPVRTVAGRCTAGCPEHGQYVDLYYRGDPASIASGWRKTLHADGWDTSARESSLDPDRHGEPRRRAFIVDATKGHARVSSVVMTARAPAPTGETLLTLTFTPG
jgi:hypothetical protein